MRNVVKYTALGLGILSGSLGALSKFDELQFLAQKESLERSQPYETVKATYELAQRIQSRISINDLLQSAKSHLGNQYDLDQKLLSTDAINALEASAQALRSNASLSMREDDFKTTRVKIENLENRAQYQSSQAKTFFVTAGICLLAFMYCPKDRKPGSDA